MNMTGCILGKYSEICVWHLSNLDLGNQLINVARLVRGDKDQELQGVEAANHL